MAAAGYTIEAASDGLTPVITGGITVAPRPATHLVVVQEPPSSVNAGSSFGLVVAALDQFGNIDSHFGGQVSIAPATGSGATLGTATSVNAIHGLASFTGLTLSEATGPVSLQITSSGLASTVTNTVTVTTKAPTNPVIPIAPQSPALPPLVTMNSVKLIENKRGQVTEILVGFSGGLNAAEAENTVTYLVTSAGRGGSFTAKNAQVIRLRSAVYDVPSDTVTLFPKGPLSLRRAVQLQVKGQAPSGLQDSYGRYIDGNRDGVAGGNAVAVLDGSGAIIEAMPSRTSALDRLLTKGKRATSAASV